MKKLSKLLNYLLILTVLLCSCRQDSKHRWSSKKIIIIPSPMSIVYKSDRGFTINKSVLIRCSEEMITEAELLSVYLTDIGLNTKTEIGESCSGAIVLCKEGRFENAEAYKIICKNNSIQIFAKSKYGFLNAIQSIRQVFLKEFNGEKIQLPQFEINDYPNFAWRGMLLDCCRHFMDKEFVKRYIDLLALHKMNRFHWHLTEDQGWRIEIKKHPKLTETGAWRIEENGTKYGGFYSQDEIREIVAYAEQRGVMIIPEIELPGHSQAALASYPKFSCTGGPFNVETEWGVFKEIYCAGNDETFQFLEDVLSEVIELFPSKYIHIGGDEVPKFRWENCAKCQKRIVNESLKDEHELQSYFINRISKFLKTKGKTLIGWDEILEGGLTEGAIVQSWRGFEGAKTAIAQGHPTIVSPTSHAYFDYGLNDIDLKKVYEFNPIPSGISKKEAALVLGGECNMWSERAPQENIDSKVFPRLLAMSEVLWSAPEKRDFKKFNDKVNQYYKCLDKLGVKYGMAQIPAEFKTFVKNGKIFVSLNVKDRTIRTYLCNSSGEKFEYLAPFEISNRDSFNISFKRGNRDIDFKLFQIFYPHLAVGKEIIINHEVSPQYNGRLNDGKKGSSNFKDGCWQGSFGNDMEIIIDLEKSQHIKRISAGFLQYNNAWIFLPKEIEVYISEDGENFTSAGKASSNISPKNKKQLIEEFIVDLNLNSRYVKFTARSIGLCPEWHDAAGSKSWLFLDEIAVE